MRSYITNAVGVPPSTLWVGILRVLNDSLHILIDCVCIICVKIHIIKNVHAAQQFYPLVAKILVVMVDSIIIESVL